MLVWEYTLFKIIKRKNQLKYLPWGMTTYITTMKYYLIIKIMLQIIANDDVSELYT